MVHLSTMLATVILASTALATPTPEKSTREIVTDIYGPLDTWTPIKLIDIYPNALINGLPANDSIIYALEPPAHTTPTQRSLLSTTLSARGLTKRVSHTCYGTGTWAQQDHLYKAKNTICNEASGKNIGNGGDYGSYRSWYDNGNNDWRHIQNSAGQDISVWFWIKIHGGHSFNWSLCYNGFWTVINTCHGKRPDSAGGVFWGYDEQIDVQVDPQ